MGVLLTIVLTGLVSGTIYSLLASGLVLAYSTTGIFNFAQGGIAFCSAYLFYELDSGAHLGIIPSAILSIGVLPLILGVLLNRLVFSHLANASGEAKVVASVGLMIALPALALYIVEVLNSAGHLKLPTGDNVFVAPGLGPVPRKNWRLTSRLVIDSNQLVVLVAAVICSFVLYLVVRHSRLGLRMRASIDRRQLASLRGIDPIRTSSIAWVMSMMLAGVAGVVGAPVFGLTSGAYTSILFVAAVAAVIGGLRSIPIAFVAGMVLAVLQNLVISYLPLAQTLTGLSATVPFILLLVAIWFLGRARGRQAGSAAESRPFREYMDDLPPWRRALPWVIATVALGVYVTLIANEFWAGIVCTGLALSVVFLSFTVVTGLGGLVSLAQASLVSIGGVTAGLLLSHEFPFPLALVGGGVAAVIFGLVVAAPSVRLSGLAFSLATLALAFIVDQVILQIKWFSGGISGRQLMRPSYLSNDRVYATVLFVIVLVVAWLVRNLNRSISGRAMGAVRSTEMGATASGISPARAKLGLFVVSSAIAGIGGVLLGSVNGQITPNSYPTAAGIIWLAVVVTFGVRRPAAAVLAGLAYAAAPQVISWFTTSTQIPTILFGLGAINLAASPDGSVDQIGRMLRALRDWIRRRRHPVAASTVSPPADPPPPVAAKPEVGLRPAAVDLTAAAETVLIADGVTAGYGASSVLRDVSLSLRRGSITAVLGANGAGKSTLCLAIAGIVPLTSGRLTMMGKDITRMSAHGRVKSGMILVPESRGIFPALTVRENLDVWLPKGSDAKDALERFPVLAKRSGASAGNLSGGEQQMLALAPLLFRPPDLLIVDEPSLGLAPRIVSEVFALFEELRTRGCALLIVEEKTTDALRVADEVIIIEAGAVSFAGAPASLDENSVASAYLGIAAPRVEHR